MPAPNPILGVHVTPGALAWARVLREEDGSFRVVAWGAEPAPQDPADAVAAAAKLTARRPFRGRGSYVALPDGAGCLVRAHLPPEELDLAGDDLQRELHEHTPFDPGAAALRFRLVRIEARHREFAVAALPAAQERRFRDAALPHDDGTVGLGFSGAALARGVRALGLAGPSSFVVEMLPRTTLVYAFDEPHVRRYLVAAGADDVIERAARAAGRSADDLRDAVAAGNVDSAAQDALVAASADVAADVQSFGAYHVAQEFAPKDPPPDAPRPAFVAAGAALSQRALRHALAAHLGPTFAATAPAHEPGARVAWQEDPGDRIPALAGAVGAALEAFQPPEGRLSLVPPPADVPEETAGRRGPWIAAAVAAVLLAGAALAWQASRPAAGDAGTAVRAARLESVGRAQRIAARLRAIATAEPVLRAEGLDPAEIAIGPSQRGLRVSVRGIVRAGGTREATAAAALAALRSAPGVSGADVAGEGDDVAVSWDVAPSGHVYTDDPDLARGAADLAPLDAALADWARAATARREAGGARSTGPGATEWATDDALSCLAAGEDGDAAPHVVARATDDGVRVVTTPRAAGDPVPLAPPPPRATDNAAEVRALVATLRAPVPSGRLVPPGADLSDLTVAAAPGPDGARLTWPAGRERVLLRRDAGSEAWGVVADVPAGTGEMTDDPEGGPGTYHWRLDDRPGAGRPRRGREAAAELAPAVRADLLGADPDGRIRFRVTRTWRGAEVAAETSVAVGAWIAAEAPADGARRPVALDAGLQVARAEMATVEETVRAALPEFGPDGRVVRAGGGAVPRAERDVLRAVPVLLVDLVPRSGGGVVRVSRKMTDG